MGPSTAQDNIRYPASQRCIRNFPACSASFPCCSRLPARIRRPSPCRPGSRQLQAKLDEGRDLLDSGEPEQAAKAFEAASGLMPDNPEPLLLLAEARRGGQPGRVHPGPQAGHDPQSAEAPGDQTEDRRPPRAGRALADAIATLLELRDADELGDPDILRLAHLQTRVGQHQAAFQTLERIQRERPDDVDAKVVEAEILLAKGDELLAGKLMDRLLEEHPGLTAARMLRARYFLQQRLRGVRRAGPGASPGRGGHEAGVRRAEGAGALQARAPRGRGGAAHGHGGRSTRRTRTSWRGSPRRS